MKSLETNIALLLEKISPADLKLRLLRASPKLLAALPSLGKRPTYSLSYQTRSFDEGAVGDSVRLVVEMALDGLVKGPKDVDPPVPSWYALSRMQREVVEQTLDKCVAEHRANAARLNLRNDRAAGAEYEIADAYKAALEALAFEPLETAGSEWEPLVAREAQPVAKSHVAPKRKR